MQRQNHLENYFSGWKKNQLDSGITSIKTTPQNVKEAHEALFHATMNLPNAAAHCGMTIKQLKLTFREYLKYNEPDEIV